jgi:putative SOS response-associated peptidase YedK
MCSRYLLLAKLADLQQQFEFYNSIDDPEVKRTFSPTDRIPVVKSANGTNENEILYMRWSLIPSFIKDFDSVRKYSMFNARSESLEEKPAFKKLLTANRCLIPADVFYEFKEEGPTRNKYGFTLADKSTFAMAGLWDQWVNPKTGEELFSCTIITTNANEIVRPIHEKNRMPVILEKKLYQKWLDPRINFSDWKNLLLPYDSEKMKVEKIVPEDNIRLTLKATKKTNSKEDSQPSLFSSKSDILNEK